MIHINYFTGVLTLLSFLEGAIGPSPIVFGSIGHSPIEEPLWTSSCKIETSVHLMGHLFSFMYIRVEFWANHTGVKSDMLLGTIGEQLGNLKKLMGTYGENDGNKGK